MTQSNPHPPQPIPLNEGAVPTKVLPTKVLPTKVPNQGARYLFVFLLLPTKVPGTCLSSCQLRCQVPVDGGDPHEGAPMKVPGTCRGVPVGGEEAAGGLACESVVFGPEISTIRGLSTWRVRMTFGLASIRRGITSLFPSTGTASRREAL